MILFKMSELMSELKNKAFRQIIEIIKIVGMHSAANSTTSIASICDIGARVVPGASRSEAFYHVKLS